MENILELICVSDEAGEIDTAVEDKFHEASHPLLATWTKGTEDLVISDSGREGIEREEHAMSTLTLVTENITESQNEEVAYSLSLLKEFEGQGLDVIPVGKFNAVVEAARQDMRV